MYVRGVKVQIAGRAYDVLLALAERCDRVVSKAELLDVAWPGVVVEENNLTVQIAAIRRVLGHNVIATVTGRGYRLASAGSPQATASSESSAPTPETRLERRLVALVQADIVGWVRLVARDPLAAAAAWKRVRTEFVERMAPRFGGRPIELTAERMLLEFSSAVEGLNWALELQSRLEEFRKAAGPSTAQSVHLRIGMAVDDLIVDDGKLIGDGVNVAADLQLSAGHDEVLITRKVLDFVVNKVDAQVEPLGERLMRRTRRALHVFRVSRQLNAEAPPAAAPAVATRLASLAVLPFTGDAPTGAGGNETYFGDGITEEVIASLSLNRSLFVIAHGSTLQYRQSQTDLNAIADALGVRYLVTGSVRRFGDQLRIHVSLITAADQRILWQERFDGDTADVFGFQSQIAEQVAAAIAPPVQDEEVARVRQRPTKSYDAYDYLLRGLVGLHQLGTAEFDVAGDMFRRAIELDPSYAQAHGNLAWWYSLRQFEGRLPGCADEANLALEHALLAVRLDSKDAMSLSVAGYVITMQKKHDEAMEMFEQALAINPSCAAAWARHAATLFYLGRGEESFERIQRAMRLSPFDQMHFWHLTICGGANFVRQRYGEAAGWLGKALRLKPRFNGARRLRIAALTHAGEIDEARELARELLEDTPDFSVREYGRWSVIRAPHRDQVLSGLRQAGLPD